MSPEIEIDGDEVWAFLDYNGERFGRGCIVKGGPLNEDDALELVSMLKEVVTEKKIRAVVMQRGLKDHVA